MKGSLNGIKLSFDYLTKEKARYDPVKKRDISLEQYQRFMELVELVE